MGVDCNLTVAPLRVGGVYSVEMVQPNRRQICAHLSVGNIPQLQLVVVAYAW